MLEKYALFRVIKVILEEQDELSIRDIAKKANVSVASAKASIDFLLKENILNRRVIGRSHLLSLNKESVITRQIKILSSLVRIEKAGLVEEIIKKYQEVISVILYGSIADGTDDEKSDIDILVISKKPIKIDELKAQDRLDREISFIICTIKEWQGIAKKDKVFYDRVLYNCINLYGEKPVVL